MDSRPFQIFEGSNEMLYAQIADMVTRLMRKQKQLHLFDFLKDFKLTSKAALHFKKELGFAIGNIISQRKLVDLGRIIGRIVSVDYVIDLHEKGFRNDLIENCINMVKQEVSSLICSFHFENTVRVVDNYSEDSAWLKFV